MFTYDVTGHAGGVPNYNIAYSRAQSSWICKVIIRHAGTWYVTSYVNRQRSWHVPRVPTHSLSLSTLLPTSQRTTSRMIAVVERCTHTVRWTGSLCRWHWAARGWTPGGLPPWCPPRRHSECPPTAGRTQTSSNRWPCNLKDTLGHVNHNYTGRI